MIGGDTRALAAALAQTQTDGVDSDWDGVPDVAELLRDTDGQDGRSIRGCPYRSLFSSLALRSLRPTQWTEEHTPPCPRSGAA
jgi:hypothetical protein